MDSDPSAEGLKEAILRFVNYYLMKAAISVITLGVSDMEASVNFYTNVLKLSKRPSDSNAIVFYDLENIVLALFPKSDLAKDAEVLPSGSGFSGVTLANNVGSEDDVRDIIEDLRTHGTNIVKEPGKTSWGGYDAYFADPDGYLWEIVYNPFWSN